MKIKLNNADKVFEILAALLLISNAFQINSLLSYLPNIVATHFNEKGIADEWGSKYNMWINFGVSICFYLLFTFISFKPGVYKYRMTKNNVEEQYRLTAKMSRTLKVFTLLSIIGITHLWFEDAKGGNVKYLMMAFLIFFALVIPPCVYYIIKFSRLKN